MESEDFSTISEATSNDLDNISVHSESNSTLMDPKLAETVQLIMSKFVPLVFGIIVFVGALGNMLVITVVATNQTMRNTTNVLILNLAVADLLFIVFCVPFTATDYAFNYWPFGLVWCQTVQYLIYVTSYISIYTLILMSVDRFLAVVCPVTSLGTRTVFNASLAIFATWTIVACLSVPIWMTHHLKGKTNSSSDNETEDSDNETLNQAWCRFAEEEYSQSGFQIAYFVSGYAIPLLMIVIMYVFMLKRLWHPVGHKISRESLKNKRRVTRLVLIIIVVFAVCWAPIQFVLLLKAMDLYSTKEIHEDYFRILFQVFAHVLAYLNSCINPILYAFLSDNFRKAFYHFIPSCLRSADAVRPALRYELTTLKSSFRASSRESSRRPLKRRRHQDNSYEESIGNGTGTGTGNGTGNGNGRQQMVEVESCIHQSNDQLTTAAVVINHLNCVDHDNLESIAEAAKAISEEMSEREQLSVGNGSCKNIENIQEEKNHIGVTTSQSQTPTRPHILTFDEKRKRAKLVVISAGKLSKDVSMQNGSKVNGEETTEDGDKTVKNHNHSKGRVLCTRL